MVDSLLLLDAVLPVAEMLGNVAQDLRALVPAALEEEREVGEAGHHLLEEALALGGSVRARVEVSTEGLADLLDLALKALALEEGDEDVLLGHLARVRILDLLVNLGVLDVDVATSGAEENLLKNEEVLAENYTADEAELHATALALLDERSTGALLITEKVLLTCLAEKNLVLLEHLLELDELIVVAAQGLVVGVHVQNGLLELVKSGLF